MKKYIGQIVFLILISTFCMHMSGVMNTTYYTNVLMKPLSSLLDSNDRAKDLQVIFATETTTTSTTRSQVPSITGFDIQIPWWDGGACSNRTEPMIYEERPGGHCGRRASALGPGQKVVSMCIYGGRNVYYKGIEGNLNRIKEVYPGYVLRLYLNPRLYKEHLCPLLMKYEHLYVCDITNLPSGLGNISDINPRGWRYSPMGDPHVDVLLVRDSEVTILSREVSAVKDWLASKATMHVMKDIPVSNGHHPVMAGCWGVRSDPGKMYSFDVDMKTKLNFLREVMFDYMKNKRNKWNDQYALKNVLYPILRNDMVRHDSFFCMEYPGSRPFPTQRNGTKTFVGQCYYRPQPSRRFRNLKCPVECRPPNHRDWEYC